MCGALKADTTAPSARNFDSRGLTARFVAGFDWSRTGSSFAAPRTMNTVRTFPCG